MYLVKFYNTADFYVAKKKNKFEAGSLHKNVIFKEF